MAKFTAVQVGDQVTCRRDEIALGVCLVGIVQSVQPDGKIIVQPMSGFMRDPDTGSARFRVHVGNLPVAFTIDEVESIIPHTLVS